MGVTFRCPFSQHVIGISFTEKEKVAQSCLSLCDRMTVTCQAPLSLEFSRQEYWNGQPFSSPGDLPNPGIKSRSPTLQGDSSPSDSPGEFKLRVGESLEIRKVSRSGDGEDFGLKSGPLREERTTGIAMAIEATRKEGRWVNQKSEDAGEMQGYPGVSIKHLKSFPSFPC